MTKQVASKLAVAGLAVSAALVAGQRASGANNTFLYVTNPTGNPTPTSASVSVPEGTTFKLDLFLQESVPGGNLNIVNGDGGLLAAGIKLSSPAGGTSVVTGWSQNITDFGGPVSINGSGPPTAANGTNPPPSATSPFHTFSFAETTAPTAATGVQEGNTGGGAAAATPGDVYLGSVTLTAGAAGSSTTFSLGEYSSLGGNTLTNDSTNDLDAPGTQSATLSAGGAQAYTGVGTQATTFTINATAVPEPASLGLLSVGGLLALRRRRRA